MKIIVRHLVRHKRMMPHHRPVEWVAEELRPLLQLGEKRNEVFGCDETQLAANRLIDQHLRLERNQLAH